MFARVARVQCPPLKGGRGNVERKRGVFAQPNIPLPPLYDLLEWFILGIRSRSSSFLFGSFSFVDCGGYVDNRLWPA
jgi:hypothetical protein